MTFGITKSSRPVATGKSLCPSKGLIFLEHGVRDFGLETVKWAKEWIAKVGEQRLVH